MSLPPLEVTGDLPIGVHPASLQEVLSRFGSGTVQRTLVAMRLERVYNAAATTGQLKRFIIFGSFVTAKPDPNDVDVFLIMQDTFDVGQVSGEALLVFDHAAAQSHFGASVFWLRPATAFPDEVQSVADWQLKRDGSRRGVVEVIGVQP
jgi:hypothetical protein